jgi:hypothetical protein
MHLETLRVRSASGERRGTVGNSTPADRCGGEIRACTSRRTEPARKRASSGPGRELSRRSRSSRSPGPGDRRTRDR